MNYKRLYENLIQKRQSIPADGYTELHHITPRSLGGTDDPENLVALTAREHFIAHYLLSKMYPEDSIEWHKMNHAFMMMKNNSGNQDRYFNSRLYESARKHFRKVMSKAQSGTQNSQYGTRWMSHIHLRKNVKARPEDIERLVLEGFEYGRNLWKKFDGLKTCKSCNIQLQSKKANWCDSCRPSKEKTVFRKEKIKDNFSDSEKLEALIRCHGNIRQALFSLGLNDSGTHYRKMKDLLSKYNASVYPLATNQLKG